MREIVATKKQTHFLVAPLKVEIKLNEHVLTKRSKKCFKFFKHIFKILGDEKKCFFKDMHWYLVNYNNLCHVRLI
jgi:hypothetical protein